MSSPASKNTDRLPSQRKNTTQTLSNLNDFDFLTQKIVRLQQDYADVCAELQKVRTRLRKAQDFEIKYDLILKQKQAYEAEITSKDNLIAEYQQQVKQLEIENAQIKSEQIHFKVEKDNLMRQVEQWRLRFLQAEQISSRIRAQQEYKMSEKLSSQIQITKKQYLNLEEQYKTKIRILEINLAQKNALQSVLKERSEKSTVQKDKEIQRLEQNLSKLREEHLQYAEHKNKELINVANRFETLFNNEIQKLKSMQQTNSQKFSLQVEGLRGLLELKNSEINQLLAETNDLRQSYLEEKTILLKQISLLKEKLYQRERQSELELYNLKERLISLHRIDTKQMNQNFEKINLNLEENIRQLEDLIKKKDMEIKDMNERFEARKLQLEGIIEGKNTVIAQLQQKLRHTGDMNAKEIDNLHSSFHKITTEKGQLSTEYQTTFNFLNTQITKLTSSNELKNQQIKDLHMEVSQVKKNFSQHIKDLERKWRLQRKQRQEERTKEREVRQNLEEEFREKQQKWRHRQRVLERDKEKQEREKIKQKVTIEELQKNVQRLTRHVKQNEERLKVQMQRNQSNFVETGSIRRQLAGQIQRQKAQFESMKKLQIDQVHRQYEIEMTRLNNDNQRLQNELTDLRITFDKLQEEYKKAMNTTKNVDRINKEKLIDYQRKMATLNAEINLTQNLYNSFLSAKSKVKKGEAA